MSRIEDLKGKKFGKLEVLELVQAMPRARWLCVCDCGNKKEANAFTLKNGKANSCGCAEKENRSKATTIHGYSNAPTYRTWVKMKHRTTNPNNDRFHQYGGRGIKLCEDWKIFENFLKLNTEIVFTIFSKSILVVLLLNCKFL